MNYTRPLIPARLIRRYKRFLADIELENGQIATAHCANPGAMLGLAEPGMKIWVEPNDDPKRKLRYSWKLVELPGGHLAGIDTSAPNKIVGEALRTQRISEYAAYQSIRPEVRYGKNSRIDFLLQQKGLPDLYLEIKNVHLRRTDDLAEFPDCVTKRGRKHLVELGNMVATGHRACMLYLVQRTDCARFALAHDLDPGYSQAFDAARIAGVGVSCYDCVLTRQDSIIGKRLAVEYSD